MAEAYLTIFPNIIIKFVGGKNHLNYFYLMNTHKTEGDTYDRN